MGIGFGAVAGSPKSDIGKTMLNPPIWARMRLLLYSPPVLVGEPSVIKQGFPKTGGVILFGD